MHTRHAAVGLLLVLGHTGCLVPAHDVRALFAQSETHPFSTLFVRRTDSGEMLELGYVADVQRSSEPVTLEWVDIREQLTMDPAERRRTAP